MRIAGVLAVVAALLAVPGAAQEREGADELNPELNEQVLMLPYPGSLLGIEIEVTIFRPHGAGPFPLLVINHGKEADDVKLIARKRRYRYGVIAREFVKRGWLVAVPMRRGFGRSGGNFQVASCNLTGYGLYNGEDVRAAIDALAKRSDVDPHRIAVFGQSAGGLAAVAYSTLAHAGTKAVVNFAGGLRLTGSSVGEACWDRELVKAFGRYGETSRVPQLWVYTENDLTFPPHLSRAAYERFRASGGVAEFALLPAFKADGHRVFGDVDGLALWLPKALEFLDARGLPVTPSGASGFAALDDVDRVPAGPNCRKLYADFLAKPAPRAFAIGPQGNCGWWARNERAAQKAVEACEKRAAPCRIYAYDELVVWRP
jgi:dienelactone hydrolase